MTRSSTAENDPAAPKDGAPASTPGQQETTSAKRAGAKPAGANAGSRVPEVKLTADRIVVEHPDRGERTSRGGLLIPATAQPAPKRCVWAEVALVGPEVRGVQQGDRILFLPQAGLEVDLEGEDYLLLRERDVQAVAPAPERDGREPGQYL
ncbi:MAG: co-chaperone GroES [Actinomycetota bacterium]